MARPDRGSQVCMRLSAGGRWIRTIGSWRKGAGLGGEGDLRVIQTVASHKKLLLLPGTERGSSHMTQSSGSTSSMTRRWREKGFEPSVPATPSEVKCATDTLLEGERFEPSVPRQRINAFRDCRVRAMADNPACRRASRQIGRRSLQPRDRWFADSPLEGDGFELPVPRTTPGFWPISTRTTRRDRCRKKGVRIRQLLV